MQNVIYRRTYFKESILDSEKIISVDIPDVKINKLKEKQCNHLPLAQKPHLFKMDNHAVRPAQIRPVATDFHSLGMRRMSTPNIDKDPSNS